MSKETERWEYVASLRNFTGVGGFFPKNQKQKQLSGPEKDLKK